MESVIINNAPFVISNDSDYYFDGTLHSTYGFEIYYRPRKGIRELDWNRTLDKYGFFSTYPNRAKFGNARYFSAETRYRTIDCGDFMDRPFVFHFSSGNYWFGVGFDGNKFVMQDNNNNYWLPDIIL